MLMNLSPQLQQRMPEDNIDVDAQNAVEGDEAQRMMSEAETHLSVSE